MTIRTDLAGAALAAALAVIVQVTSGASPSKGGTPPGLASTGGDSSDRLALESQRPVRSPAPHTVARVSKILVFVIENHSLTHMKQGMPYTFALGRRFGYATRYAAITHPSLPNYLAMIGGSTFHVRDDDAPRYHPISGSSVLGRTLKAGRRAALYAEGMTSPCDVSPGTDTYAVKHNPWAYFVDERQACLAHDLPIKRLRKAIRSGHLPNVGMVVPNLCNDAHDCPLSQADNWLQRHVRHVMRGPDWRSHHLAIVITADEDDRTQDNRVLTVVAQPGLHHVVADAAMSHYSLSKALAQVGGVEPLRHAAHARSLLKLFGLKAAHQPATS
jgi:phosphatidylinositol-3-phosphatase